jgi:acetolactate synthase-1/2/3 large subunit
MRSDERSQALNGAQAVAKILKMEGTEYLFCFPANTIIDAAAGEGIKPIMVRSERTAVAIADGYTRALNAQKIGVCAFQNGPGTENSFGGVAQAYSDGTPLLILPGGPPIGRLGVAPNFEAAEAFKPVAKWSERINRVNRVPEMMRRAYTLLRMGKPGPVVLELAGDAAGADISDFAYAPVKGVRSAADPADVAAAAKMLLAAKKPLLHVGHGVLYARAWDELRELAELIQAPVMTTLAAKSVFPENHPLSVGSGGHSSAPAAVHFLKDSDLVFGIGCSFAKSAFACPIPAGKPLVQMANSEGDINKEYPVELAVIGDAKLVLQQLVDAVKAEIGPEGRKGNDARAQAIKSFRDASFAQWAPNFVKDDVPINPYRVIGDLMKTVNPAETIITHDSGNPRDQLVPFWMSPVPRSYIGWGKSTHLGWGLGVAMGAKLAKPEKLCINLMGDAAFGMIGMDVETAVRNKIGTLTILLNNSCLGGYAKHLEIATERYRTRYLGGDYAKVAEGLGAYSEKVTQPAEVIPAIKRAIKYTEQGQPALLEFITAEFPHFPPNG